MTFYIQTEVLKIGSLCPSFLKKFAHVCICLKGENFVSSQPRILMIGKERIMLS